MDQIDTCYYYASRANAERALAQGAASPVVAAIHAEMASLYEDRAAQLMASMTPAAFTAQAA